MMVIHTKIFAATLLVVVLTATVLVEGQPYSGPCLESCCCKVCSAPENAGYPYGVTTVDIQTNPTNPQVAGASCHFSVWSDRSYDKLNGDPATPPDTLWWTESAVFGDTDAHSAPISCDCCRLSVDTSCAEQPPLATRPKQWYVVGGDPIEDNAASLVFEKGVQLSTGDYIELRNDTFCGYTRPPYAKRSSAGELTINVDPDDSTMNYNTWAIPRLPSHGCYRICYYHSGLTTPTWYDLGTITIYGTPNPPSTVVYQLDSLDVPLEGNVVTLRFKGSGLLSVFDDAAQLRTDTSCGADVGTTSTTIGTNGILEVAHGHEWCQPAIVPGITSLRPLRYITPVFSDCPSANRLYQERVEWTLTLPAASTYYVCYRKGGSWLASPIGTFTVTAQNAAYVALQALYTATNGPSTWTRSTGWDGTDACAMYGVRCEGSSVVAINLGRNNVKGTFPTAFFHADFFNTIEYLAVDENEVSGTIPHEIGVFRNLKYLNLGVNQITGSLPPSLQRTSLQLLYSPMNEMDGSVPDDLAAMRELWTKFNVDMDEYTAPVVTPFCAEDPMECSDKGSTDLGVFECGYGSITEAECLARGCCFNSQAPLVFGGTSCFTKRSAYLATNPVCIDSIACETQVPAAEE